MREHGRPFRSTDQGVRSDPDKPPDGSRYFPFHFSSDALSVDAPCAGHPALQAPVVPNGGGIVGAPLAESNDGEKTRKRKAPVEDVAEEGKKKRSKKPKDPNAPRRPASSYILYQNHVRKDLRAKFPTLSNAELLSMISKQWAEMTEDEKLVSPNSGIVSLGTTVS